MNETMKLTDRIHLIRIDFEIPVSPGRKLARFVNSIIIFGDTITLIDTGVKGSEEIIFAAIEHNHRRISDIKTIILSHSHPDHIGAAGRIKELTGCTVLAHQGEAAWIGNIEIQNRERPVPGFYSLVDRPVDLDEAVEDGQILHVAEDISLEAVHAPGHSKFQEDALLFTADSIPLKNDIPNYDNYRDLMTSLSTIRANNRYNTLLTSWTPPLTTRSEFEKIFSEGEEYMAEIDKAVKESYIGDEPEPLAFCKKALDMLGLPPFFVMPIVDRAFRSH
jgi:hydroxyacylglutathione hydrolase